MIDAFAAWLAGGDKSPRTVAAYRQKLTQFAAWNARRHHRPLTAPAEITATDARDYRRYLLDTRRAQPATVNAALNALRAVIAWAHATGQIESFFNPLEGVKDTREQKNDEAARWLERTEQAALEREAQRNVAAVRDGTPAKRQAIRDWALVVFMLNTGLRVGEACGLTWGQISVSDRKWEVRVEGKGAKWRTVPLHAEARKALAAWRAVGALDAALDAPVFVGQRGEGLQPRAVQRLMENLGDQAGLMDLDPPRSPTHVRSPAVGTARPGPGPRPGPADYRQHLGPQVIGNHTYLHEGDGPGVVGGTN